MELNRKLNPSFQNARIPTGHPLLVHVCAIAYTCKSNCLFMYKQQAQRVMPGRTGKGDKTFTPWNPRIQRMLRTYETSNK